MCVLLPSLIIIIIIIILNNKVFSSYRFDVSVQEAHRVDGLDGLQDLLPEPQGGAHGEGASGLTPPQVGKVTPLQQHRDDHLATRHTVWENNRKRNYRGSKHAGITVNAPQVF